MILSFILGLLIGLLLFAYILVYANRPLTQTHNSLLTGLLATAAFSFGIFTTYFLTTAL